jgi:hypothetical protein
MTLESYATYKIQFFDNQVITAKFIREEQLEREIILRCKFVIGKTITIRVSRNEFVILEKVAEGSG